MAACPKCKSKIPTKKLFFSGTVKCMSCSSDLVQKNKKYSILIVCAIVALNALIGSYLIRNWYSTGDSLYLWLFVPYALLIISEAWFISAILVKLEIAKPYMEVQSPAPPPPPLKIS
jgi:hypothetical protein